jgi:toxin ParE1/3/4
MSRAVTLSASARRDLDDILDYLSRREDQRAVNDTLARFRVALESLAELPGRGRIPPELAGIGLREFREIQMPPYRVLYRISGERVQVLCIVDARRDLSDLVVARALDAQD